MQYVYPKAGKAYSVVGHDATGARVRIEIPAHFDAVQSLLKAMNQGLKIMNQKLSSIVSQDQTYPVPERRDGYCVTKVARLARRARKEREGTGDSDYRPVCVSGRRNSHQRDERETGQRWREEAFHSVTGFSFLDLSVS
jgi:hypothetical protein